MIPYSDKYERVILRRAKPNINRIVWIERKYWFHMPLLHVTLFISVILLVVLSPKINIGLLVKKYK